LRDSGLRSWARVWTSKISQAIVCHDIGDVMRESHGPIHGCHLRRALTGRCNTANCAVKRVYAAIFRRSASTALTLKPSFDRFGVHRLY
jgi:hypothetical protein